MGDQDIVGGGQFEPVADARDGGDVVREQVGHVENRGADRVALQDEAQQADRFASGRRPDGRPARDLHPGYELVDVPAEDLRGRPQPHTCITSSTYQVPPAMFWIANTAYPTASPSSSTAMEAKPPFGPSRIP